MTLHSNASLPAVAQSQSNENPQQVVRDRYDWTLISLEAQYPSLDPDSSEFNEDLMFEVCRRLKQLVAEGVAPARGLELAAAQVLRSFSPH